MEEEVGEKLGIGIPGAKGQKDSQRRRAAPQIPGTEVLNWMFGLGALNWWGVLERSGWLFECITLGFCAGDAA
jgi:hypothetical protein